VSALPALLCGLPRRWKRRDYLLTMPASYAALANNGLHNQLIELPVSLPPLDVYLYWHESRDADPANAWLRNTISGLYAT
jgi:DNA-binding transcriptional LysR family regulator